MEFQFKQFFIRQDRCAFKVGTDSVLLGSWVNPKTAKSILDIGTGSGILALMMAQKTSAEVRITAIDLDEGAYAQATENASNSPWKEKLEVIHSSLQQFEKNQKATGSPFDLIITNPPYFVNKAHATGTALSNARNTALLPFVELAEAAFSLLQEDGSFFLVLPTPEAKVFEEIARKKGFILSGLLKVHTKVGDPEEKRRIMRFQKSAYRYEEEILTIEERGEPRRYTEAYRAMTQDFYL